MKRELVRARERLDGAERPGDRLGAGSQLLGEPGRERRIEMPLDPADALEGDEERRQEPAERVEQLAALFTNAPSPYPLPLWGRGDRNGSLSL